jgi:hypothetical protein
MAAPDQLSQALVVGVSQYQHLSALMPTQDVPGMRDVLASPDYCGYPPENVKVLDEEAATKGNIIAALDAMCERAAPGSRTFFYFSGHGGRGADGSSYLLPADARKGEYANTAISARDLSRRLDRCAGELTVVLDCCRAAGMAAPGGTPAPAGSPARPDAELAPFTDSLRDDLQSRGRVIFAASRADGGSWASPDAPYGIFTGHLLDGLRGAASTHGGDVTVQQLFDYVSQRVVLSSGKAQRPVFIANVEAFYPLTRYPRSVEPSVIFEKDVYISYDHGDPVLREWVAKVFRPELERQGVGLSIWDHDELGGLKLDVEEAIVKSRYVVLLLTQSYLQQRLEELTTTMAILQAVNTRTRRFIPIQREMFHLPLYIQAFAGIDLTPQHEMEFRNNMDRLIRRLKKPPHEH